jgi:hypothetical protein
MKGDFQTINSTDNNNKLKKINVKATNLIQQYFGLIFNSIKNNLLLLNYMYNNQINTTTSNNIFTHFR